ncbi:MAG TPA: hypothetical protein VGA61_05840, partial [Anaerolineae bacterium]
MMANSTPKTIERGWLEWLAKVRLLLITLLLGIESAVVTLTPGNLPKRTFILIIALGYAIAAVHGWLLRVWREDQLQAKLQIFTDLCFATGILYV